MKGMVYCFITAHCKEQAAIEVGAFIIRSGNLHCIAAIDTIKPLMKKQMKEQMEGCYGVPGKDLFAHYSLEWVDKPEEHSILAQHLQKIEEART